MRPSLSWISSIVARPRPMAVPPSIWPSTPAGLITLPTSWTAPISTTRTRPSSESTSTTARSPPKTRLTWMSPCPFSSKPVVGRWWYTAVRSIGSSKTSPTEATGSPSSSTEPAPNPSATPSRPAPYRLARRRGGPGRAHTGVGRRKADVLDAQLGLRDLGQHREQALATLDRGGANLYHGTVGPGRELDPGLGRVVEALAVRDVLVPDCVADAAPQAFAPAHVARSTWITDRVAPFSGLGRRHRHRPQAFEDLAQRRGAGDHLAGGQDGSRVHSVAQPDLQRIHTQRFRELVHLALVRETDLRRPESAHGAARWVVRVNNRAVDRGVGHLIWPGREGRCIGEHRGR